MFGSGQDRLGEFRSFCLHERLPAEAQQMGEAARQMRRVRQASYQSRRELAARLGVALAVVVAIENGYGNLAEARRPLARASQFGSQGK